MTDNCKSSSSPPLVVSLNNIGKILESLGSGGKDGTSCRTRNASPPALSTTPLPPLPTSIASRGSRSRHHCSLTLFLSLVNSLLLILLLLHQQQTVVVVDGQQNPSIVQITPGQTVDLGDTIDLSCSVQYGANYPIIWTKLSDNPNNPPLFISKDAALTVYDNRYSIRHDDSSSTYTLQVSKIQDTDTGAYQCQVVTSATSRVTADTFISVRIPPLILDTSSRGLIVGAGETFTLSCNATGVPTPKVSWRRENNGLLPTGGVVAKGNAITIYNATKDDRGIYYCIADNSVGKAAKRSVGVEIEFAPQVNLIRAKYQQALGYPAELHCSVEASPASDISWLKDGYQINSDNNFYHISSTSNSHDFIQSTLRIKRVEQRDFGSYRCRAINKLGDRQNTMLLERAYEPICPPACTEGEYLSITTSGATRKIPFAPDYTIFYSIQVSTIILLFVSICVQCYYSLTGISADSYYNKFIH